MEISALDSDTSAQSCAGGSGIPVGDLGQRNPFISHTSHKSASGGWRAFSCCRDSFDDVTKLRLGGKTRKLRPRDRVLAQMMVYGDVTSMNPAVHGADADAELLTHLPWSEHLALRITSSSWR